MLQLKQWLYRHRAEFHFTLSLAESSRQPTSGIGRAAGKANQRAFPSVNGLLWFKNRSCSCNTGRCGGWRWVKSLISTENKKKSHARNMLLTYWHMSSISTSLSYWLGRAWRCCHADKCPIWQKGSQWGSLLFDTPSGSCSLSWGSFHLPRNAASKLCLWANTVTNSPRSNDQEAQCSRRQFARLSDLSLPHEDSLGPIRP